MTLTITSPADGATVKGVVPVVVDAPGVQRINFYVDAIDAAHLKGRDLKAPFRFDWYTTNYPDGQHTIYAVAGNGKQKAQVTCNVANGVTPPPPPPPGDRWPASFFTGPLGQNNIVPTSASGIFLSATIGGLGYPWLEGQQMTQERQQQMGRIYDVLHGHWAGDRTFHWPADQYGPDVTGAAPLSYWNPTQADFAKANGSEHMFAWGPGFTIAEFNQGVGDPVLKKMATYLKSLAPQRVMIRFWPEFDLPTQPYGIRGDWTQTFTVTPAQFGSAWHRVVDIFHNQVGATNVGFMINPTEGAIDRGVLATYMNAVGADHYDWVGTDWYNTVYAQSSPLHAGWATWEEIFHYDALGAIGWSQYAIYGGGYAVSGQKGITLPAGLPVQKPFMIGETGSLYDQAVPTRKGDWFRAIPAAVAKMPYMAGISFFDVDASGAKINQPTGDYDWRVDRATTIANVFGPFDQATLDGFVAMAKDPAMRGRP